jgi:hypothetical protein
MRAETSDSGSHLRAGESQPDMGSRRPLAGPPLRAAGLLPGFLLLYSLRSPSVANVHRDSNILFARLD